MYPIAWDTSDYSIHVSVQPNLVPSECRHAAPRGASISHGQELQGGQRTTQETNGYRSQVSWGRCGAIGEKFVPRPLSLQVQSQQTVSPGQPQSQRCGEQDLGAGFDSPTVAPGNADRTFHSLFPSGVVRESPLVGGPAAAKKVEVCRQEEPQKEPSSALRGFRGISWGARCHRHSSTHSSLRGLPCPVGVEAIIPPFLGQLRGRAELPQGSLLILRGKPLSASVSSEPSSQRLDHNTTTRCPSGFVEYNKKVHKDEEETWRTKMQRRDGRAKAKMVDSSQPVYVRNSAGPRRGNVVRFDFGSFRKEPHLGNQNEAKRAETAKQTKTDAKHKLMDPLKSGDRENSNVDSGAPKSTVRTSANLEFERPASGQDGRLGGNTAIREDTRKNIGRKGT